MLLRVAAACLVMKWVHDSKDADADADHILHWMTQSLHDIMFTFRPFGSGADNLVNRFRHLAARHLIAQTSKLETAQVFLPLVQECWTKKKTSARWGRVGKYYQYAV